MGMTSIEDSTIILTTTMTAEDIKVLRTVSPKICIFKKQKWQPDMTPKTNYKSSVCCPNNWGGYTDHIF